MEWLQARDGGFFVRSDEGDWAYAYPTSPHARVAQTKPEMVAREMAAAAKFSGYGYIVTRHNEYLASEYQREYDAIHAELGDA